MRVMRNAPRTLIGIALLFSVGCESPTGSESTQIVPSEQGLDGGGRAVVPQTGMPNLVQSASDGVVSSSFPGNYFQFSPCDGIRYEVFGTYTLGVRETILDSKGERVVVSLQFLGRTQDYALRLIGSVQLNQIAAQYDMDGIIGLWDGRQRLPDFEIVSSATVFMSNGAPRGVTLTTVSARCVG